MNNEIIYIDGYESKVENRVPVWYAYSGKGKDRKTWKMPSAYQEMYDEKHLAIMRRTLDEIGASTLGDDLAEEHYIPLLTGGVHDRAE